MWELRGKGADLSHNSRTVNFRDSAHLGTSVLQAHNLTETPFRKSPYYFLMSVDGCHIGVDRANGRYLAIVFRDEHYAEARSFGTIDALWEEYDEIERLCIDVPIGLPEGAEGRDVDRLARKHVGKRNNSVFPVPVRDAVYASSWSEANQRNREATQTEERPDGKGISGPAEGIREAIREVDQFLHRKSSTGSVVEEVHPELCFRAFRGDELAFAKKHPKKQYTLAAGMGLRLKALDRVVDGATQLVQQACMDLTEDEWADCIGFDDVVDAFAAAFTARPHDWQLRYLGEEPMRMAYQAPEPLDPS